MSMLSTGLEKNAQLMEYKCVPFVEELMYGHLEAAASYAVGTASVAIYFGSRECSERAPEAIALRLMRAAVRRRSDRASMCVRRGSEPRSPSSGRRGFRRVSVDDDVRAPCYAAHAADRARRRASAWAELCRGTARSWPMSAAA